MNGLELLPRIWVVALVALLAGAAAFVARSISGKRTPSSAVQQTPDASTPSTPDTTTPSSSSQKPKSRALPALFGSFFRGFFSTAFDFIRMRYGRRGQFWAFPVQGNATIVVKQGIQDRILFSGSGPRSIERTALANQRNAQFLLELKHNHPEIPLEMPDTKKYKHWKLEDYLMHERVGNVIGKPIVDRVKTFPVPPKDDSVEESQRYDAEVTDFDKWLDVFHQENREFEAALLRLNQRYDRQLPYVVLGTDRRKTSALWMGMPWNHWVYGHQLPNYIGLFVDGLPTTISLQETPYHISKWTDVKKRRAEYPETKVLTPLEELEDSVYVPETPTEDGIPTNASEVVIPRVHDPGKATFVLENGAIPLIRIRSILNQINPYYRQAVATLRWDAVVRNIEDSLKGDGLFGETLTEEQIAKLKGRIRADIRTMITQQINTIYQVKLGIVREIRYRVEIGKDDNQQPVYEERVRYVDWNVQTMEGVTISRYPESNPGMLAQIQRDWGIYIKDVKIQDVDPDEATQKKINELVQALFDRVKAIVTASGEGKRAELLGIGAGKAEEALRTGIAAGLVRQKEDLGIKDGALVLQLDTARTALPGIGTKVLVPNSDPGGLFSGLMGAAMAAKATVESGQPNPPGETVPTPASEGESMPESGTPETTKGLPKSPPNSDSDKSESPGKDSDVRKKP